MKIAGLEVVDVKNPLILHIGPEDIRLAGKKNPETCAAAKACVRQLKASAARVHLSRIYVLVSKKWRRYFTPKSLRAEIISFDRGGSFEPSEHRLVPVNPAHQGKGYRQGSDSPDKRRTKRTQPMIANVRYRARSKKSA
jgi:hypothetical protein